MKSKKMLIVAYKAYKRGAKDIAKDIFAQAMEDETAPELMEELFEDDVEDVMDVEDDMGIEEDLVDDIPVDEEDFDIIDMPVDEEPEASLSVASIKKLRGIANRIAAEDGGQHRDIAKKLLYTLKGFEKKRPVASKKKKVSMTLARKKALKKTLAKLRKKK